MIVKPPEQQNPLPSEARAEALKLLHSKGGAAFIEVERLLGWNNTFCMTHHEMAQRLDITYGQLRYLLQRDYRREKAQEQRIAENGAKKTTYITQTSHNLTFSILLPEKWRVITDTHNLLRPAQEYLEVILRSKPENRPVRSRACFHLADDGRPRPLTEYEEKQTAKTEYEERKEAAQRRARLERMATGFFQAEPIENKDQAFLEITKLQLDGRLTAVDLYKLDKFLPEQVAWGNHPKEGMVVDGLTGVIYYYTMRASNSPQEEPVFFNVYLAYDLEGWILSCQCQYGDPHFKTFTQYKPMFKRIISSFKRLHIAGTV